ncbi:hypothetical protein CLOM_g23691 [Closterium sp. NIES-68]|nr:hypothetical protein CLOM_g23691 [Closterium sp. NIES-68]GJP62252.1 hypothetical protein CLOP_g19336 [Closterium sp. NIES-67]GJP74134.1 hypothetical protein CLOP_g4765 [Closterium sp. NIES-67]GJP74157.1 hypothetical protein CLOP_g4785 [Closterium sp. NIES-67]
MRFGDASKLAFCKANTDNLPFMAQTFNVSATPTVIIFQRGRPVETISGDFPMAHLLATAQKYAEDSFA